VKRRSDEPGPLTAAAAAVESALERFEQLARAFEREPLDTEKSLRRAAQGLDAVQAADARLGEELRALVTTLAPAQERQHVCAEAVRRKAEELRQRSESLATLLRGWEAIGAAAAHVNRLVQALRDRHEADGAVVLDADEHAAVDEQLAGLGANAERLAEAAEAQGFPDLGRQADGLRTQLAAARNKLRLSLRYPPETEKPAG
jgi:hypothetical protein